MLNALLWTVVSVRSKVVWASVIGNKHKRKKKKKKRKKKDEQRRRSLWFAAWEFFDQVDWPFDISVQFFPPPYQWRTQIHPSILLHPIYFSKNYFASRISSLFCYCTDRIRQGSRPTLPVGQYMLGDPSSIRIQEITCCSSNNDQERESNWPLLEHLPFLHCRSVASLSVYFRGISLLVICQLLDYDAASMYMYY